MNATQLLFDVEDGVIDRPRDGVPAVVVTASEENLTAVAGVALWGPLLDRLGITAAADRRGLRPIGPGGYTGGECYRALVETQLAGGNFLSDRTLLADDATSALRGTTALPSVAPLSRFVGAADLGWTAQARIRGCRLMVACGFHSKCPLTWDDDGVEAVVSPEPEGTR